MTKDVVFHVRVDAQFNDKLIELRKAEDDLPSVAEMLRRLVNRAHIKHQLKASKAA